MEYLIPTYNAFFTLNYLQLGRLTVQWLTFLDHPMRLRCLKRVAVSAERVTTRAISVTISFAVNTSLGNCCSPKPLYLSSNIISGKALFTYYPL